ncbi:MAG: HAD family hydrolase [Anaerolineales bacterium]|nr:HAD family hydrolase [Anaerolineales bacterium]
MTNPCEILRSHAGDERFRHQTSMDNKLSLDNYTSVFFDLDGTLRHSNPPARDVFYQFAAELGLEIAPEQRIAVERWVNQYWADSKELLEDLENLGPWRDNLDFWVNHARRQFIYLGTEETLAEELALAVTVKMRETYESEDCVPDDVVPTLTGLRQAGFKLGLVSNRNEPLDEIVESLGLMGMFDLMLAAGEVGWYKPDPRLLQFAAERLGVEPGETIYLGDNFHADVLGASAAGMTPVLLDPRGLYPEADCWVVPSVGVFGQELLRSD